MSRPIRILLTIPDLSGGGAEREFSILVSRLSRERFEPHLCFHRPIYTWELPDDLPVHLVPRTRPWHTPRAIRGIRAVIDRVRPDVVFSQIHYANMLTGSALARTRHRPRWACRQVNDPRSDMRGPFALWARRSLARADRVLGACEGVSQALIEHLKLDPSRVGTLVNAVDVAGVSRLAGEALPIERDPDRFVVVHAGRLGVQKNQALLLAAFAQLTVDAELWMLGEGELRDDLEARAQSLGIEERVRWLGFQANPHPFFRSADCLALSSNHEGLPNAVIEAMLCGTPCVSTRAPYGPEELIEDGRTGFLTPVGDAVALAGALARMAEDRDAARRMGEHAREQTAARFDTTTVCAAYEALFEGLARDRNA